MKKRILWVGLSFLLVAALVLTACAVEVVVEEEEEEEVMEEEEEGTPSGEGGLTWGDMPVYSGGKQIQKGSWTIAPSDEENYSKVEWRYYESGDSANKIMAFYRSQMPNEGWQEMGWMEAEGETWGFYNKNNERDGAMVWVAADDGNSVIALMRASQ